MVVLPIFILRMQMQVQVPRVEFPKCRGRKWRVIFGYAGDRIILATPLAKKSGAMFTTLS